MTGPGRNCSGQEPAFQVCRPRKKCAICALHPLLHINGLRRALPFISIRCMTAVLTSVLRRAWRYCRMFLAQELQNANGNCSFRGLYEAVHSCEHSVLLTEIGHAEVEILKSGSGKR